MVYSWITELINTFKPFFLCTIYIRSREAVAHKRGGHDTSSSQPYGYGPPRRLRVHPCSTRFQSALLTPKPRSPRALQPMSSPTAHRLLQSPPPANPPTYTMVKEKNHTNRNQSYKAHRRGIKKVKPQRYRSLRGVSVTRGAKRKSVRGRARSADSALHALQGMEGVSFSGSATVWGTGAERRHCLDRKQQQHGMVATSLRPHPRARVSME